MKKLIGLRSSALLLALGISLGVQAEPAARLGDVQGQVLINRGRQYVPAERGDAVQRGHRVLVSANSSAILRYADDCILRLDANQLLVVTGLEQCRQAETTGNIPGLVAVDATTAKTTDFAAEAGAPPVFAGLSAETLAVIGAITVSITAIVINQTSGGGGDGGGGEISPE